MKRKQPHKARKLSVRVLRIGGFIIAIAGLCLWVFVRFVAPPLIVEPSRSGVGAILPDGMETCLYQVADGIQLTAWRANPKGVPNTAIIVLHGIADSKSSQAARIRDLAGRGVVAIAPDLRAHGDSDGLASYGYHEKHDLVRILDSLESEFPGIRIGLWGTSYGGAVALQAVALDPRFDFAIIESTFADLGDMGRAAIAGSTSLPLEWLAPIALSHAGDLADFDVRQVSPEDAIKDAAIPILHFHGDSDEVIPFRFGERIRDHATRPDYRFVRIAGGGHYNLWQTDPGRYNGEIDSFLESVTPGAGNGSR